ncbi:WhiB family transcriptional regulator [Saccharopolyspora elongata]|uniref:WhiB family transcriptional regulator n=1 Tax=Saccharopolyspora elongata TaxID=2530387 RepID=UPI0038B61812
MNSGGFTVFRDLERRVNRHGRCVNATRDEWFPEPARGADSLSRQRQRARWACADCPVQADCLVVALSYELDEGESWGIWGGVCARDRRQAIRLATQHPGCRPDAFRMARRLLEELEVAGTRVWIELGQLAEFDQRPSSVRKVFLGLVEDFADAP